jgi:integrase
MTAKRNRRAGVEDLWRKSDGTPSKLNGTGLRWRARYVDESGAERSKRFRAKAGAQTWLDSQTAAIVTGTYVDPQRSAVTVRELAEGWYASKSDLTPKTKLSYRSLLDTLVLPQWRDLAVRDVDHDAVQVWIAKLRTGGVRFADRPLSASRVIQAHNVLSAVLDRAVRQRYLTSNPAKAVELPRKPVGGRRYLTHGEVEALAEAIGDEYRLLVLTFAYTGLRWGEAVALRARNVNAERGASRSSPR